MSGPLKLSTVVAALLALAAIAGDASAPAQAQPQNYYPGWAAPPGFYAPRPQRPVQKRAPAPETAAAPVDATELINRGDDLIGRGEFDRAIALYDRAIKGDAA